MALWEKQFNFLPPACGQNTEKLDTSLFNQPHACTSAQPSY